MTPSKVKERSSPATPARPASARAYAEVKRLILDGDLQPADKLNVRILGERLGVTATPLKVALAALARDGLVTAEPNRGYFVTVLRDRDVFELFELREALEPYAVRTAVARGVAEPALALLREMIGEQRQAARQGDRSGYNELSLHFHRMLWRLCGNGRLNELMEAVVGQMSLVTTFTSRAPGRLEAAIDEHALAVDLCEAGQDAAVAELLATHVRATRDAYRRTTTLDLP